MFTPADLAKKVNPSLSQGAPLLRGPLNELGAALSHALDVADSLAQAEPQKKQIEQIRLVLAQKGNLPGVQHAALGRLFDLSRELGVNYGDLFGGDAINHRK